MKTNIYKTGTLLLLFMMYALQTKAGWPIGKKHYLLSSTFTLYKASKGWNRNGALGSLEADFTSQSGNLYIDYGLTRTLDVVASLPYSYQTFSNNKFGTYHQSGAGDFQVGFSTVLKNFKYTNYLTLYIGASAPLYKNTDTRILGMGNAGIIARVSGSGMMSKNVFYNLDLGGGQYFGVAAPIQGTASGFLGFNVGNYNQINVGADGVYSSSSDKSFNANTNAAKDFWYSRVSAGFSHSFSRRFNLNLSGFYTVAGRNTGQGYGAALTASMKLPYFGKSHERNLQ